LLDIIENIQPDVVHLEEMPEYFMDNKIAAKLYSRGRKYKIIETSHDSSFDPKNKLFFPDHFTFVSQFQKESQKNLGVPSDVIEYPITIIPRKPRNEALKVLGLDPNKKHVIHVGLFTPRKNQAEIVEYARSLIKCPIQFHFIGNQADKLHMVERAERCRQLLSNGGFTIISIQRRSWRQRDKSVGYSRRNML
jgi:glycosyltransferase involved in cell wall biosynthesis